MRILTCLSVVAFFTAAHAEELKDYHIMTLESTCGCEPSTYMVVAGYGNDKYKTLHVYEDGTVRIPRSNDDQPEYMKIKGVGVISVALRPTPTRLTKLCPGMPHLPEQANWGQPQDGNQIPIYCFLR